MHDFAFHRPATLAEAVGLLSADPEARPLSGGQTLLPALKHRLAQPTALVDLSGLSELREIRREGDVLVIGALATHHRLLTDDAVRGALPVLARMAASIGDTQVRNRGTIGGSVANNDPTADYPTAVIALGGTVRTSGRAIPAEDFFLGMFATALEPGELVVAIELPLPRRAGYAKMRNPASRYSMTGVFVADGAAGVRVVVNGAGPAHFRQEAMEAALTAEWSEASVGAVRQDPAGLNADIHGGADYRAHLVTVMARRAVADAG